MNARPRAKSWPRGPLAQLRSVSHALVSSLQKRQSKTSKLIRFGSLHFRGNWGWSCTAVRTWFICSNRKLYHKSDLFATVTLPNNLFRRRLSDHLHRTNRPFTYALRKGMSAPYRRSKRTPFRKNFLNEISRESNLNRTTWLQVWDGSFAIVTPINCSVI